MENLFGNRKLPLNQININFILLNAKNHEYSEMNGLDYNNSTRFNKNFQLVFLIAFLNLMFYYHYFLVFSFTILSLLFGSSIWQKYIIIFIMKNTLKENLYLMVSLMISIIFKEDIFNFQK